MTVDVIQFTTGALSSNSTTLSITAGETLNVAIIANTLLLSEPLNILSGGTGVRFFIANSIVGVSNVGELYSITSTNDGQILQIIDGNPVFAMIDGGIF